MKSHTAITNELPQHDVDDGALLLKLVFGYLLFIVYGSLLPFEPNALAFEASWSNFQRIPLLQLGVGNRADLVANLLLYVPFGFLTCAWLVGNSRRPLVLAIGFGLALMFATVLALAVEFTQQFFAPRTVSLNDIYAELTGAVLGIVLWPVFGRRFMQLGRTIFQGGANARYAALVAYALAFLAMILFPYDFLLSYDEWQVKLASDNMGWLFAQSCGHACILKLIPEALAVAPIGMLGILVFTPTRRASLLLAAILGMLLGIVIEGVQLTIASGISQGASIGSRAVGVMLGVWLMQTVRGVDWRWARQIARGLLVVGMVPYLIALAWLNNWFSADWLGLSDGLTHLTTVRFTPLYYHYYTSETVALVSLLFQAGLYMPWGVALWVWRWAGRSSKPEAGFGWLVLAVAMLASLIEAGKLFIPGQHPDPTNVLIAAVAAAGTYRLLHLLFTTTPSPSIVRAQPARVTATVMPHSLWAVIIGSVALCAAAAAALTSPLGAVWVLPPLLIYVALLWRWPGLWLVWVLALLPLLDLTPWSGRLFWTEYDTLLLATIGVGYLNLRSNLRAQPVLRRTARLLLTLFSLSALISLGIGLWPLGDLGLNAFASYTSSYNALRAAKGLVFALLFIPLLAREWGEPARAVRRLAWGMTLGLAAVVLYVLWERATFPGLFNFETDYRITGPFPGMHTGGAYIEGFLATALPFVALWAWQQRRVSATVLAAGLFGLGAYSVMVTFSRGGQAAFALATLIELFGFMRLALRDRTRRFVGVGAVILIASLAVAAAWPVFSGKYSQSRMATTGQDVVTRTEHWMDVLHILQMRKAMVFGLGLGAFPSAYFWSSGEPSRPSTYAFVTQNGNTFMRLGSGETLYFEQSVAVVPEQRYTLAMDLRASGEQAELTVPVCEKALLYSFTCVWTTFPVKTLLGQWMHYETEIQPTNLSLPGSLFPRPIKLSFSNGRTGTLVDVDNVTLRGAGGNNLVRNGDFSSGLHHWFFSTDSHLSWHVKNLYFHVLFEQGWLGLICFIVLIGYALARWLPRAWHNDPLSLTLCASFAAFLVVGVVDSLIDETRLGFVFYFLLIAGLMADARLVSTPHHAAIRTGSS